MDKISGYLRNKKVLIPAVILIPAFLLWVIWGWGWAVTWLVLMILIPSYLWYKGVFKPDPTGKLDDKDWMTLEIKVRRKKQ